MQESNTKLPLFVDLDGTLIKSDVSFESLLLLLKKNPLYLIVIPFWVLRGLAFLKQKIADRVQINPKLQPLNEEFLAFLHSQNEDGRPCTLISASNQKFVNAVNDELELFAEAIGSDDKTNLKSTNKLNRIRQITKDGPFSYAGNSTADLKVWEGADEAILVNCSKSLVESLKSKAPATKILQFDAKPSSWQYFVKAIRPHQWLKNMLIFLPLILSHQLNELALFLNALIAFLSFSLCASSVYLLNDMLDLDSDRQHKTKHRRPFAVGNLSLAYGFAGAPILLLASFLVALLLPAEYLLVLVSYSVLTSLYSFSLKRMFLIDVFMLGALYTLRIMAGSAAISVETTNWLLAFSFFLFVGLALVKRFTELKNLQASNLQAVPGRSYSPENMRFLLQLGAGSSLIAVAVFAFYINAPATMVLYSNPIFLWAICPMLLMLLWRIWHFAYKGKLDEDPVMFAITDRASQAITLVCGLLIWLSI